MYHPVKEKNMKDLTEYRRQLWVHPQIKFLFFEMTDQCNLNCLHCGSRCTGKNRTYLDFDLMKRVMCSVADRYDPYKIMISITGGEPMLHPDIYKTVMAAHKLGFPVGMTSNGTMINERAAKALAFAGLDTIAISLDGIEDTHDAFRQSPGSFSRAMHGVHALRAVGIEAQAITVIHRKNIHQLDEMFDFFRSDGFYSWRLVNIEPIGRAKDNSDLMLNPTELRYLLDFIREKRFDNDNEMDVTYGCSHFLTYDYEREVRDFYFQCAAGTQVASIMADGSITACLDIERRSELIQGNAYEDDFIDVWENRFKIFRYDRTGDSRKCSGCKYRNVCMGDSVHTWNYDENEPSYCLMNVLTKHEVQTRNV